MNRWTVCFMAYFTNPFILLCMFISWYTAHLRNLCWSNLQPALYHTALIHAWMQEAYLKCYIVLHVLCRFEMFGGIFQQKYVDFFFFFGVSAFPHNLSWLFQGRILDSLLTVPRDNVWTCWTHCSREQKLKESFSKG